MTKTKIAAVLATLGLAIGLTTPVFAQDADALPFLPDVENVIGVAMPGAAALSWDPVVGADTYLLYYGNQPLSLDNPAYENEILVGNEISYTVENLTPGISYYFAVAAEDSTLQFQGSENYSYPEVEIIPDAVVIEEPPVVEPVENPITPEEPTVEPEFVFQPPVIEEKPEIVEPEIEIPIEAILAEEIGGNDEPKEEEEPLPDSGPGVALAVAISTGGAYLLRRRKQ